MRNYRPSRSQQTQASLRLDVRASSFLMMASAIAFFMLFGCKPQSGSAFGTSSVSAVSPPREIKVSSAKGMGLADNQPGIDYVCKEINGQTYCGMPDQIAKVEAQQGAAGSSNAGNAQPASSFLQPVADTAADKWFTGDKTSYYQPLTNIPGMLQNFDASGKPTGVFLNKADNQMIRFNGGGFDAATKKPVFDARDQIWNRDPSVTDSYKYLEQRYADGSLVPTGNNFYYGNIQAQNAANLKAGYGYVYEVNAQQYLQSNSDTALAAYLTSNKNLPGNLLIGQSPLAYTGGEALNIIQPSALDKLFIPLTQQGGATPVSNAGASPVSGGGGAAARPQGKQMVQMLVSGTDCSACPGVAEKNAMRQQGIPVFSSRMADSPYATSFPSWVSLPADQIPASAWNPE